MFSLTLSSHLLRYNHEMLLPQLFGLLLLVSQVTIQSRYGVVWHGKLKSDDRPCVLKLVKFVEVEESYFASKRVYSIERWQKEMENALWMASLDLGPQVYLNGITEDARFGYLAMEPLDFSLKHLLLQRPLTSSEEKIIQDLLTRLHQENGLIHGDLKPNNIAVQVNGSGVILRALLLDFPRVHKPETSSQEELEGLIRRDMEKYSRHVRIHEEERRGKKEL